MEDGTINGARRTTIQSQVSDRVKLNVGGKLFETTVSTLRSGGPDSLLSALSNRNSDEPVFIDRDPEIFSALLALLRSNRLPSTAKRFSNQELIDEAVYYGIESQLRSALAPSQLSGIDASLLSTIRPSSDGVVTDFNAVDSDGSVWVAHGGQVSVYDWSLTHTETIRTHLDYISSIRKVGPDLAVVGSEFESGLHFYNLANGRRVGSVEWTDPSDPRIYKAKVNAVVDSPDSVFAAFECQHRENCVLSIDKCTMKAVSELGRQSGNSAKSTVVGKLTFLPEINALVGVSVTAGAFGYSGYVRLWDPRSGDVVWETNEPGSGRSSRFGDSFADIDFDRDELTMFKICSKSGDLAVADLRKLSEDPWVYLEEKNPCMRHVASGGSNILLHCYRKQVFVGRGGELEVWSRMVEKESDVERERVLHGGLYRRNYMDKVEDAERGIIKKIEGAGDRLFVTREDVEGIEVWQSSQFSGAVLNL
ncbi:protein ENDOPLASMIC RETICULUM-ARRESTED PEN3 [Nicotiana tabacum]|uniref:BTB/POZ domain-containing protein At3g09030 n=1 Tax=Nicotiana tabacum TaxID=4097 RepID=A0A1S3Z9N8_TOBAC|nr:BTB/POZ domain-containing protein At3g09030 [Nicotiana tomentosiformis]XP_016461079.1 PREDICTED: BTB/POZ domain-containing protein At3g09030-like [Nicotiana tabacum]